MSWKPEVTVVGEEGKWQTNGLAFATKEEAEAYALDLFNRWTLTTGYRATEYPDAEHPVNYRLVDGHLEEVKKEAAHG